MLYLMLYLICIFLVIIIILIFVTDDLNTKRYHRIEERINELERRIEEILDNNSGV